jgi:hypothetical protein
MGLRECISGMRIGKCIINDEDAMPPPRPY